MSMFILTLVVQKKREKKRGTTFRSSDLHKGGCQDETGPKTLPLYPITAKAVNNVWELLHFLDRLLLSHTPD